MSKKISKQSLDKFEERIRRLIADTLSDEDRQELDGAYLSTYECYSTITEDHDNGHRKCNSAIVLMRVLKDHGINILGVTSERKNAGQFVAPDRVGMEKVVYVGKHSYFTNKKSHKWRILPIDKV